MRSSRLARSAALLAVAGLAAAAKIPEDFRAAFEQSYRKQAFAVVVQEGLPTMSVHGPHDQYKTGHYEIDVQDGRWKTASKRDDPDQVEMDRLRKGEVMTLAGIGYKDTRIDIRIVALEPRKITRKAAVGFRDRVEPVATKLRFFLPFETSRVLTPADLPAVRKYIEAYLRVFPDEASARSYAARLSPRTAGTAAKAEASRGEVRRGMTTDEVREALGKPLKEVTFGASAQWKYPDRTVVFENGRVRDVKGP